MKATYKNSFCTNSDCINYFEDMCMIAMAEKEVEIEPFDGKKTDKKCKEFKVGTCLAYLFNMLFPMKQNSILFPKETKRMEDKINGLR